MSDDCTPGLVQLKKLGVDVTDEGREICRGCGKPARDSTVAASGMQFDAGSPVEPVIVVTMNDIPGHQIVSVVGDVFGFTVGARTRGANAIVAVRFDCDEIGDIVTEVAAHGAAVIAVSSPITATAAD